ncbi:MAG TPA: LuxR C-terminal-related transcriptional regulator [Puia sp.]|jgi:DNA-binding CsgD family transcriptional regulator|nr:LuxR C-terminal-related transcriptional regulator [Puia sp.]
MKNEFFKLEFNKVMKRLSNESAAGMPKLDLDFYNKLLNFFLVGDSYYFILNHQSLAFEFVSKEEENVLGYYPHEFNIQLLNSKLHPDDRSWFLLFGKSIADFFSKLSLEKIMKYKIRYDVRYRKMNGEYARILYQGVFLEHDENGRYFRSLGAHTDITYLKQEGIPELSFIGTDGEPSYHNVDLSNKYIQSREDLTRREKQVLRLLIEGKLSKEISNILNISKQTVDTHRKNMLCKKKLNNTSELVGKALRYGWI